MKTILRTAAAFLLLAAMLLTTACSTATIPAMEYEGNTISVNMYKYWLSRYKAVFLYSYSDITDTAEFWNTVIDSNGTTYEDFLTEVVNENIKSYLVAATLCEDYGIKIDAETEKMLDEYIDELINELGEGSRSQFNQYASAYGVNSRILKDVYVTEEKLSVLYEYLYGENGKTRITDEQKDQYYHDNYYLIQHLYINDQYEYILDENGNYSYGEDGYALTRELTADELAAKTAAIEAVKEGLESGETFESLYDSYSEDKFYPNGYYLTVSTQFVTEIVTSAVKMNVGDVEILETDLGFHVVKKYPLNEKAYEDTANADFFDGYEDMVGQYFYHQEISSMAEDVVVHEDAIADVRLSTVTANYSF